MIAHHWFLATLALVAIGVGIWLAWTRVVLPAVTSIAGQPATTFSPATLAR